MKVFLDIRQSNLPRLRSRNVETNNISGYSNCRLSLYRADCFFYSLYAFQPAIPAAVQTASSSGGTLIVGSTTPVETLDIQDGTVFESLQQVYPLYNSLVEVGQKGQLTPGLATAWSVASDDKSLTLTLRHGVKFTDGSPLNAQAVVFNLERETSSKNQYHKYCTCTSPMQWLSTLATATATGTYSVKLTFASPSAYATLWNLTAIPGMMMSPAAIEKYGSKIGTHAVGTGPYELVSWAPGSPLVLQRNPDYWWQLQSSQSSSSLRTRAIRLGKVPY